MDFHDSVSSISHLFTAAWAVFVTLILYRLSTHHGWKRWSMVLFGISMGLLYLASGLYHGIRHETEASRVFFQKLDKSAIYLFIYGSHLPIYMYMLRGRWRPVISSLAGVAALAGLALVWLWPEMPHAYLVGIYLALGLSALVVVVKVRHRIGWRAVVGFTVFAGCYVVGAIVELAQWPVLVPGVFGPHEFLHIANIVGTLGHFVVLVKAVLPWGTRGWNRSTKRDRPTEASHRPRLGVWSNPTASR